ncbi:serine hydrolase domain-containing protein [Maribacter sp.]|uniref:serine hydrolase domain-containing protein n=1 Tax=Maribacter sp. TaxID=1897614 RepID=UPI0025C57F42|nr:serine hydrolase domain-containing protein [Maribacter sp.]
MKKYALLIFLLLSITSFSQQRNTKKLDSLFDILEEKNKFMGSVAISENGKTIYAKAIGFADIKTNLKATTETKYRIGSISKTFTATLIFKAIEENKLKLSDTIATYFPNIKNATSISIKNLLNHRSGIFNFTNNPKYSFYSHLPKTRAELLDIIKEKGVDFAPNTKSSYSNSNYVLLTFILEDIYQKPYALLLKEKITNQLGLQDTYVGGKINLVNKECNSYTFLKKWYISKETHMSIPLGAGYIISTPKDLNTFYTGLFQEKIITKKSIGLMTTITDGLGLGIFQVPFHNQKGFGHTGGIDGFSSFSYYFPKDNLAISLTSNGNNYVNNNIAIALLSSYYKRPFTIPTFKNITLKSKDLDNFLGIYSSNQMPLKITISKNDNTLIAQATGQSSFPLKATEWNVFEFTTAGIRLEFHTEQNEMTLKQEGKTFLFKKE